jgi:hypothetical protein
MLVTAYLIDPVLTVIWANAEAQRLSSDFCSMSALA